MLNPHLQSWPIVDVWIGLIPPCLRGPMDGTLESDLKELSQNAAIIYRTQGKAEERGNQ